MKIKRYVAPDIRQAIRMVRDEQGPDAVILSNKRTAAGVEIIAAIDYSDSFLHKKNEMEIPDNLNVMPESELKSPTKIQSGSEVLYDSPVKKSELIQISDPILTELQKEIRFLRSLLENQLSGLAWSDMQLRKPVQAALLRKLNLMGLSANLCKKIVKEISLDLNQEHAWRKALSILSDMIPIYRDDLSAGGGIVALVGPSGVGKTTTIAKIAARYALKNDSKQVVLVTTDNYRIGGQEQLRVYSRILGISLQVIKEVVELEDLLKNLSRDHLVLIDTAGTRQREVQTFEQYPFLVNRALQIKTFLVLSATMQRTDLEESANSLANLQIQGCIVTKADESTSLGSMLTVCIQHRLPIVYLCEGPRVPEDLTTAVAHKIVSKSVTLSRKYSDQVADDDLAMEFGETNDHVPA